MINKTSSASLSCCPWSDIFPRPQLTSLSHTNTSTADLIGRAAFATIDITTDRFRGRAHLGIPTADAAISTTSLIEPAAEQASGSEAALSAGKTEIVGRADAVDALLRIVAAAAGSVDVVAQRGAKLTGVWFGILVNALVLAAFLIGGAAEEARLGLADGGVREEAWVLRRGVSRDAFAVFALEVPGADGEFLGCQAANLSVIEAVAWKRNVEHEAI